jgi:hypothetical protein
LEFGFIRLDEDHCLFIYHHGSKVILLFIYVDDIHLAGSNKAFGSAATTYRSSSDMGEEFRIRPHVRHEAYQRTHG